eukprot:TRINITY_DN2848_c0_g2_i2.p1 TRINITY_DN2848_c0_g2~~TRINITY_DN2848_c0_g2_i2.p1  ORF type:complete len:912 (+),score=335.01 TRINITY_DN2848_c0_g2_i2:57-2738(+)
MAKAEPPKKRQRVGPRIHPLILAANSGDAAQVEKLLREKADVGATVAGDGKTALHAAAGSGSLRCAELLLAAGADRSAPDLKGRTPAQYARQYRNAAVADLIDSYSPQAAAGQMGAAPPAPVKPEVRAGAAPVKAEVRAGAVLKPDVRAVAAPVKPDARAGAAPVKPVKAEAAVKGELKAEAPVVKVEVKAESQLQPAAELPARAPASSGIWLTVAAPESDTPQRFRLLMCIETFDPQFDAATALLKATAAPRSRTARVHLYEITTDSLYSAATLGMTPDWVLDGYAKHCRTPLPSHVSAFIRDVMAGAGEIRLVLDVKRVDAKPTAVDAIFQTKQALPEWRSSHYLEGPACLVCTPSEGKLVAGDAMPPPAAGEVCKACGGNGLGSAGFSAIRAEAASAGFIHNSPEVVWTIDTTTGLDKPLQRFEVRKGVSIIALKRMCKQRGRPVDTLYAYAADDSTPKTGMTLRPRARLRHYQHKCVGKIFDGSLARSGVVVLPCGAGKTLTGISCAARVGRSVIVIAINNVTAQQWCDEFWRWTTLHPNSVSKFTSDNRKQLTDALKSGSDPFADVVVTTYVNIGYDDSRRAEESRGLMQALEKRVFGLMILDEVHVAPADQFQRVIDRVKYHSVLGLTATMLREDDAIADLGHLVGPTLHEENWQELTAQGFLARILCVEVRCPMTPSFIREYMSDTGKRRTADRLSLQFLNPCKLAVTEALVRLHHSLGDKILIFSDSVAVVKLYAELLHLPCVHGGTPEHERVSIIECFKHDKTLPALVLTRVAETGVDIPDANVLVQVSSLFGSQRQEAQRMGRVLRPKIGDSSATFYSLVSLDTREAADNVKRRRFLLDQGYEFRVVSASSVTSDVDAPLETLNDDVERRMLDAALGEEEEEM